MIGTCSCRSQIPFKDRLEKLKLFRQSVETITAQECKHWADMTIQARLELEQALQRDLSKAHS
ncbi:hypothetical protein W02_40730 [Nitrospira sp. KM1]|nr:hypothetical protein W02_40730 [Nitrospira sp. KM1]